MNNYVVLGLHWAHDASVSLVSLTEGIVFSIAEERVSRIKHHYGFPYKSILKCFDFIKNNNLSLIGIAISRKKPLFPFIDNNCIIDLDSKNPIYELQSNLSFQKNKIKQYIYKQYITTDDDFWKFFPDRYYGYYLNRLNKIGFFSKNLKYFSVAHHRAHAATAFRFSNFKNKDVCIITLDGKGDGYSGTIYKGFKNGEMRLMHVFDKENSLGSFYQAVTEALGFIPVDGEYKTMGLAALGKKINNPLLKLIKFKNGKIISKYKWKFRSFNLANPEKQVPNPLSSVSQSDIFKKYLKSYSKEQLAFFVQETTEKIMLDIFKFAISITNTKTIATAGGVMLNVKANQKIKSKLRLKNFFVFPDSADSGLSVGAAMEGALSFGSKKIFSLGNIYLGCKFDKHNIRKSLLNEPKIIFKRSRNVFQETAILLSEGLVIGNFQGRMEMGPRGLGNRSVLADPRDVSIKDKINFRLKGREYFVPFAPIVLEEDVYKLWRGDSDYKHMTFSVNASKYAKKIIPAVVHFDGTMRPQVVNKFSNNFIYNLLIEFKKITGIGVLINTSFNRHGLPIVNSPEDAIFHLKKQWIECLVIDNFIVKRR